MDLRKYSSSWLTRTLYPIYQIVQGSQEVHGYFHEVCDYKSTSFFHQKCSDGRSGGQGGRKTPDFGRIEGAAGQWRCVELLLAHPDFQNQCHP